jgi:hypothetical protein
MLSDPKWRIAAGAGLLTILLLGLTVAGGRWLLLETRRHVVVDISNVDGVGQVFINCHLAARVESGEPSKTAELGWLGPDDRIFLSTTSIDSTPAWSFHGTTNGGFLFEEEGGETTLSRFTTTARAVVFARAFSAAGAELGAIGCQPPDIEAVEGIAAIEGYAWSPDDREVDAVADPRSSYRRPNEFYDRVDAVGGWALIALAGLGLAAAAATPTIRRAAWAHKAALAGGSLAILGTGLIEISVLLAILTLIGIALLLWVAFRLIGTGWIRLKGAAGTGGSQA